MISKDSVLRRLPPSLNRKQAFFLDGIRHAGEIAGLAYVRLQHNLTRIALEDNQQLSETSIYTAVYLDAWALIDVIDRFRALWLLLPNAVAGEPKPGTKSFAELTETVRNLRNVADHLAQRADYVISRNGTALGELSWYTTRPEDPQKGIMCTLVPGTINPGKRFIVNPVGHRIETPTGLIHLTAGEYTTDLSAVIPEMNFRLRDLEQSITKEIVARGWEEAQAGADLLIQIDVDLHFDPQQVATAGKQRETNE